MILLGFNRGIAERASYGLQERAAPQVPEPLLPVRAKRVWLPLYHGQAPSGISRRGPVHLYGPVLKNASDVEQYGTRRSLTLQIPISGLQAGATIKSVLLHVRLHPGSGFTASVSRWNPPDSSSARLGELDEEMSWDGAAHQAPKAYELTGVRGLKIDPANTVYVIDIALTALSRLPKHDNRLGRIELSGVAIEYED